ncbi:SDR family NAD(P)-dependent oxidoreductase [Actinoplanes sp. NPDC049265]|uniref:SDR family NAD(P)-dependent oxidoreductase n=1 Tax=Actinoplanes sp. NPDC049265 TaxID=3363902 RepID=UPI00371D814E
MSSTTARLALIVGASRGLGRAIADDLAGRGWDVIGTVRTPSPEPTGHLTVEQLDINDTDGLAALRERLAGRTVDLLFVAAGTTNNEQTPIGEVSTADFVEVMVTNALGPMRVVEALADLVPADGLIGVMSSGQGSITNNETGQREVYRGSKAALNMFMRGFAVRQAGSGRAFVLMAPGWIRTDLGGSEAPFSIDETIPLVVDVLLSRLGRPGLAYLDRFGRTVPW